MLNKLKLMNQKELCLWSSKVTSKELKAILKEAGIKGYSKLKKAELLEMILDLVINDKSIVINENDSDNKVLEDTKKLNEEINARQSFKESIEATLYARWRAKEITWEEFKQAVINNNISIPVNVADEEDTEDLLKRKYDLYSEYEHLDDKEWYYSIFSKHMEWENVHKTTGFWDREDHLFREINTVDDGTYQVANDYDDEYECLIIYKNYEIKGVYHWEDDTNEEDIDKLCAFDKELDAKAIKKLYKKLVKQIKKYNKEADQRFREEQIKKQAQQERERKYKEAWESWNSYYQPYSMGKYQFSDIWNSYGEIKNYSLYLEMCKFTRKNREEAESRWQQDYSNLFGNKNTVTVKEEDKPMYKRFYKTLALKFHPDINKEDGEKAMQLINKLKESWGI